MALWQVWEQGFPAAHSSSSKRKQKGPSVCKTSASKELFKSTKMIMFRYLGTGSNITENTLSDTGWNCYGEINLKSQSDG